MALGRYGFRDVYDVILYDTSTGNPYMKIDSMKTSVSEIGAEEVYSTGGRGNPRRIGWSGSKTVDITCTDCHMSQEQFALMLGSTVSVATSNVIAQNQVNMLNTSSPTVILPATPVSGSIKVFKTIGNDGLTVDTAGEITFNSTPTTGQYSITGSTITFGGTYAATPQNVLITYDKTNTSGSMKRVSIDADKFPLTFKMVGFTFVRNEADGKDYVSTMTVPRAKLLSSLTINGAVEGDPATFEMKFAALKPTNSQSMITYDMETVTYA